MLSHSPFQDLVAQYQDKNILVIGGVGNAIRGVAKAYGFKNVFTPSDLFKTDQNIYPFGQLTADHHNEHGETDGPRNKSGRVKISAILMWSSSRDMGLDLQIIMELLLSKGGEVGTVSSLNGNPSLPNRGYGQDNQPALHFCNPDLTWATAYALPRAAQGGFKAALEGTWRAQTDGAEMLNTFVVGKPTEATYVFGERALHETHISINGLDAPSIKRTYMVGDNPASDIQGANAFESRHGVRWKSILVESGVHVKGSTPVYVPDTIVPGVREAVEWAVRDAEGEESYSRVEFAAMGGEIRRPEPSLQLPVRGRHSGRSRAR